MPAALINGFRQRGGLTREQAMSVRGPFLGPTLWVSEMAPGWPAPGATLDIDCVRNVGFLRGEGQRKATDILTCTRSSTGTYIDADGLLKTAANNEMRFDYASTDTVARRNTLTRSNGFTSSPWRNLGYTQLIAGAYAGPFAGTTATFLRWASTNSPNGSGADLIDRGGQADWIYPGGTFSVYAKREPGTNNVNKIIGVRAHSTGNYTTTFNLQAGTVSNIATGYSGPITDLGNGWYRLSVTSLSASNSGGFGFGFATSMGNSSYTGTAGDDSAGVYIYGAQTEYDSANVATDYQENAISVPKTARMTVLSEPLGMIVEVTKTNSILWCRDATQSAWTKTNAAAALDQTGIDGTTNSATSLTASADNATCTQTLSVSPTSYFCSIYLKRLTGTGIVQLSSNGTDFSPIELSDTEWRRIGIEYSGAAPSVAIKLTTSGDSVAMDYAQIEGNRFATAPIYTTTAAVTRAADIVTMSTSSANFSNNVATPIASAHSGFSMVLQIIDKELAKNFQGNRSGLWFGLGLWTSMVMELDYRTTDTSNPSFFIGGTNVTVGGGNPTRRKSVGRVTNTQQAAFFNGNQNSGSNSSRFSIDRMTVSGYNLANGNAIISRIAFYPKALADRFALALTA